MEKKLSILIALILTIAMLHLSYANSTSKTPSANVIINRITDKTNASVNATENAINSAEAYLDLRLGENYTKNHITSGFRSIYTNYSSNYYSDINLSYVYFSYTINFENGTSAVTNQYFSAPLFVAIVLNQNNSVIWYEGPKMPYTAIIPPNQIVKIALDRGFKNATINYGDSLVPAVYNQYDNRSGYSVAWIVTGKYTSGGSFPVLYVDPQTGNILGEDYGFSSPGGTLPNPQFPYLSTLGNFSIFSLNGSTGAVRAVGIEPFIWYVIALIFLVVLIIVIILLKRKKGGTVRATQK